MNKLREWYAGLGQRERRVFAGLGILLALTLLWLLWDWQASTNQRLATSLPRARNQLARMQAEAAEIARLRSLPQTAAPDLAQTANALQVSATGHGLTLSVKSDGNQILASGKGVSFDNWVQWLGDAQRNSGVRLVWLDVVQTPAGPGIEAHLQPAH